MEFKLNKPFTDEESLEFIEEIKKSNQGLILVEEKDDYLSVIVNYTEAYELQELLAWFEEYDNQIKQYQRCERLGIAYDKDINELDNQAKANAERITELRNLLKEFNNEK